MKSLVNSGGWFLAVILVLAGAGCAHVPESPQMKTADASTHQPLGIARIKRIEGLVPHGCTGVTIHVHPKNTLAGCDRTYSAKIVDDTYSADVVLFPGDNEITIVPDGLPPTTLTIQGSPALWAGGN